MVWEPWTSRRVAILSMQVWHGNIAPGGIRSVIGHEDIVFPYARRGLKGRDIPAQGRAQGQRPVASPWVRSYQSP